MQPGLRDLGDTDEHVGEPGLWINTVHPGGDDQGVHHRRALPRSEPASSHDLLPSVSLTPDSAGICALPTLFLAYPARKGPHSKVLVLTGALGNLMRFKLLPGHRYDTVAIKPFLAGLCFNALIVDKPFDRYVIIGESTIAVPR